MKKSLKWAKLILVWIVLFAMQPLCIQANESDEVEIVFTHDLHSHLEGFMTEQNGEIKEMGGFARMKTVLDEKREKNPNLLVLDGGDFSMGTLYQTIYESEASELRMLGYLGFDATTLGNHEFDYRSSALINMMETAKNSKETLPEVVLCNGKIEGSEFEALNIKPYTILTKGDLKIAVIGVFGEDALKCAPTCTMEFESPVEGVKKTVAQIKEREEADMIVCVSHCGTNEDKKKSEDENLAKGVPELDLIISGHTHSVLEEPLQVGNTWIVSTGEYGSKIGNITLKKTKEGRWSPTEYGLIPLTKEINEDKKTKEKILEYRSKIDDQYLSKFGYKMDQVLSYNLWEYTSVNEIGKILREETLGNLISDSYIDSVRLAEGDDNIPVAAAIVPSGVIRDTFMIGDVTVADVFNVSSLGVGPDGIPGYPLISIYLTGKELKTAAEIDASIAPIMPTAQLYCSGLQYSMNVNRMVLNKITEVSLTDEEGNRMEIEDDALYRVVADLYSGQMLSAVTDMSYGILSVVPKDEKGNPVLDFEKQIIYEGKQELKAWEAIAHYIDSFDNIPEYYSQPRGRKVVNTHKNIIELVKNPNKTTFIICGMAVLILAIVIFIPYFVIRRIRRKRKQVR